MSKEGLVVAAAILEDERVLVGKRRSPLHPEIDGKWEFPGGRVKPGEMPLGAVIREIREELDCVVRPIDLVHAVVNRYSHGDFIVLFYLCVLESRRPKTSTELFHEICWKSLEEVKLLDALNGTHEVAEILAVWPGLLDR